MTARGTYEIHLEELHQSVQDSLLMIAQARRTVGERIDALRELAGNASLAAHMLQESLPISARRQANGEIEVITPAAGPFRLQEGEATTLRDQLDVALHVPAPDQPVDPPSRL